MVRCPYSKIGQPHSDCALCLDRGYVSIDTIVGWRRRGESKIRETGRESTRASLLWDYELQQYEGV